MSGLHLQSGSLQTQNSQMEAQEGHHFNTKGPIPSGLETSGAVKVRSNCCLHLLEPAFPSNMTLAPEVHVLNVLEPRGTGHGLLPRQDKWISTELIGEAATCNTEIASGRAGPACSRPFTKAPARSWGQSVAPD